MRDVEDMTTAPGAPPVAEGQALSGLLLPTRGEIWVNAEEARQWPPRRRFTIGHELGHWVMHRNGQQALFCRRTSVDEQAIPPGRDIEEEASSFAAGLLMPQWLFVREHARCRGDIAELGRVFGTSAAATTPPHPESPPSAGPLKRRGERPVAVGRRAQAREHWVFLALLAAGAALRLVTFFAYRPALLYQDSQGYLDNAEELVPLGRWPVVYPLFLRVLPLSQGLEVVPLVQHLLA